MSETIIGTLRRQLDEAPHDRRAEILIEFMKARGQSNYDESVTQIDHGLQCAQLAEENGWGDEAVTAALLHDIGHLMLDEHDATEAFLDEDLNHELVGANLLARYFSSEVIEPIRLHVAAKRYLCSTDQDYYEDLSDASKRSFHLQGGKLSAEEQAELEKNPHLLRALNLRRLDDRGKVCGKETPPIESFAPPLRRCLAASAPAGEA